MDGRGANARSSTSRSHIPKRGLCRWRRPAVTLIYQLVDPTPGRRSRSASATVRAALLGLPRSGRHAPSLVTIRHPDHRFRDTGCPPWTTTRSDSARFARLHAWLRVGGAAWKRRTRATQGAVVCRCQSVLPAVPLSSLSSLEAGSRGRLLLPRPPLPACSACCQRSRCRSRSPWRSPKLSSGQP
jgi:hypothetical protein